MHEKLAGSPRQTQGIYEWRDLLAKFMLFFGIALWHKGMSLFAASPLVFACILDGGLRRLGQTIKEPFVLAILILCTVLALGIL